MTGAVDAGTAAAPWPFPIAAAVAPSPARDAACVPIRVPLLALVGAASPAGG